MDTIKVKIAAVAWRDAAGKIRYNARGWSVDVNNDARTYPATPEEAADLVDDTRADYGESGDVFGRPVMIEAEIPAPPETTLVEVIKGTVR